MRLTFSALLLLFLHHASDAAYSPAITTTIGVVQGSLLNVGDSNSGLDVYEFLGIPYAEPPVGNLRFRRPVPKANSQGLLIATKPPNACPQMFGLPIYPQKYVDTMIPEQSATEDCLYLNIWSPRTVVDKLYGSRGLGGTILPGSPLFNAASSPLAVMVWIHGGGFYSGSTMAPIYNASALAAYNNVIVVSIQYRLGALGFAYLGSDEVMGNMGLWDQMEALKWVRNNIGAFGGNADRVTLFGESAGGASVGFQLLSPSRGVYFSRAIMQSGTPTASSWAYVSKDEATSRTKLLIDKLVSIFCKDLNKDSPTAKKVDCIRKKVSAGEIVKYQETLMQPDKTGAYGLSLGTFVPVIDGEFLQKNPSCLLKEGSFASVPVLLGVNKEEGAFFMLTSPKGRATFPTPMNPTKSTQNLTAKSFSQFIREYFAFYPRNNKPLDDLSRRFIEMQYMPCDNNQMKGDTVLKALTSAVSDFTVVCPSWEWARSQANATDNVYMYLFAHRPSQQLWPKWMGVTHADEVAFALGFPFTVIGHWGGFDYTPEERLLSRKMMTYWTNFAKFGDPNAADAGSPNGLMLPLKPWPQFNTTSKSVLPIYADNDDQSQTPPSMMEGFKERDCSFWTDFFPPLAALFGKSNIGSTLQNMPGADASIASQRRN